MPSLTWKNTHRRTLLVALTATFLLACQDSTEPEESTPPELPPIGSMHFDLSFFTQQGGAPAGAASMVEANWTNAALRVGLANAAVAIVLAVPVATWAAAGSQTPTVEEGKWHWRFSAQEGVNTYGSHVTGYIDGNQSIWEMRITASSLGLDEFLWYDGRALLDGTAGYWVFHDPASGPGVDVGRIDWTHPQEDSWTVQFSDINSGSPNQGDRLSYEAIDNDRSVSYHDATTGATIIEIGWDAETGAGWMIAPNYNGGQKACWDAALNDTICA